MNDAISRQAAIDAARKCRVIEVTPAYILIDKSEIMTELMCLPSAQPEERTETHACDLISRQAALTALTSTAGVGNRALDKIRSLPSAHCDYCPYPDDYDGRVQVVRCKDCTYRNGDYCHRFHDGYSAFIHHDDYCSYAERRTE